MRLGIVSDLHGNLPGLLHAIALMGPVDRLVCLGDAINQYRFSNEVVAELRRRDALTIWGNHEASFFGREGERARRADWIDPELLDWLAGRPRQIATELAGRRLLLTHATADPGDFTYLYPHSPAFPSLGEVEQDILLYGHTHQPVARQLGSTLVVNPGSAGQGRLVGDGFILSCATLDLADGAAEIHEFRLTPDSA
nr:metallophosphoesterase family protein [Sphingomonas sp. Y57]